MDNGRTTTSDSSSEDEDRMEDSQDESDLDDAIDSSNEDVEMEEVPDANPHLAELETAYTVPYHYPLLEDFEDSGVAEIHQDVDMNPFTYSHTDKYEDDTVFDSRGSSTRNEFSGPGSGGFETPLEDPWIASSHVPLDLNPFSYSHPEENGTIFGVKHCRRRYPPVNFPGRGGGCGGRGRGGPGGPGGRGGSGAGSSASGGGSGSGGSGSGDSDAGDSDLSSVGGLDAHIRFLKQAVIYPLRHSASMKAWGVEPPKGILFHGPPGTGKTLLAKALANDMGKALGKKVTFIYHKGCESNAKGFGQSEENLRALFEYAIERKPTLMFFDEIDGLCPNREGVHTQARISVVTALLGLIDSVKRGDVFIIGATNRLDAVDPAVKRPGRFDKELFFPLPDAKGRENIIKIHTKKWPRAHPDAEMLTKLANKTQGFSGADLEKLCNDTAQAAITRCAKIQQNSPASVTEEDWLLSFGSMNASKPSVFGSTLCITPQLDPQLLPLVKGQLESIVESLNHLLPCPRGHFYNKCRAEGRRTYRQTFLLWSSDLEEENFLHDYLMKGLLNRLGEIPVYILDAQHLHNQYQRGREYITEITGRILRQVEDSTSLCILYMPLLNEIHKGILKITGEKSDSILWEQINRIRGPNCILIGTHLGSLRDLKGEIKLLFSGDSIWHVQTPSERERRDFFHPIFANANLDDDDDMDSDDSDQDSLSGDSGVDFDSENDDDDDDNAGEEDTLLDKITRVTEGDNVHHLIRFFEALNQAKNVGTGTEEERFSGVLSQYKRFKCQPEFPFLG